MVKEKPKEKMKTIKSKMKKIVFPMLLFYHFQIEKQREG
jgi:hypothetical protein